VKIGAYKFSASNDINTLLYKFSPNDA